MKYLLFFISILCFPCLSYAEVIVPKENRVENHPPGYCMWAAIETAARLQRIEALYGLLEARKNDPPFRGMTRNLGYPEAVKEKLDLLKVKHETVFGPYKDYHFLKRNIDKNIPVVIDVQMPFGRHAILLTDINDKTFRFVDSNDIHNVYEGSIVWLDWAWNGYAIKLE